MRAKAIALCRVSTVRQRLEGSSLQTQEKEVNECAARHNADIVKVWAIDRSSKVGNNYDRPDLVEMLNYCKAEKSIKFLFILMPNRLMRDVEMAFHWTVQFRLVGVELVYATMPEHVKDVPGGYITWLTNEFLDGEKENHKRTANANLFMRARITEGYYPGSPHTGYKRTLIPGAHEPNEPSWSLIKSGMEKVLYEGMSLTEVVKWLRSSGLRSPSGYAYTLDKIKRIFAHPYYAGIVTFSNWEERSENGVHKPMITKEEHLKLNDIVKGKKRRFTVRKYNPLFPASNIVKCEKCMAVGNDARLVGHRSNNGKRIEVRKYYEYYRCRGCGRTARSHVVHDAVRGLLDSIEPRYSSDELASTLHDLWDRRRRGLESTRASITARLAKLRTEKNNLIMLMARDPSYQADAEVPMVQLRDTIAQLEEQLITSHQPDDEFWDLVSYSIGFLEDTRTRWFDEQPPEERLRFNDMIFSDDIFFDFDGNVRTRKLSPFYRYVQIKDAPVDASVTQNGGSTGA